MKIKAPIRMSTKVQQSLYVQPNHVAEHCHLESQFNNGRGLAIALSFLALPPPPKASTKRRANPKAIIENHLFYIHENESLTNLLDKAINSISSQGQPLLYGIGNHTGSLSPNNFTVKYTITRTEYKDISIESLQDHSTLIDTIKELSRPTGGFKLIITEFKVCKPTKTLEAPNYSITRNRLMVMKMRSRKILMPSAHRRKRCVCMYLMPDSADN